MRSEIILAERGQGVTEAIIKSMEYGDFFIDHKDMHYKNADGTLRRLTGGTYSFFNELLDEQTYKEHHEPTIYIETHLVRPRPQTLNSLIESLREHFTYFNLVQVISFDFDSGNYRDNTDDILLYTFLLPFAGHNFTHDQLHEKINTYKIECKDLVKPRSLEDFLKVTPKQMIGEFLADRYLSTWLNHLPLFGYGLEYPYNLYSMGVVNIVEQKGKVDIIKFAHIAMANDITSA